MKKSLIFACCAVLFFNSCSIKSDNGFPLNFQVKEGKGIIKNKEFEGNFDEIKVSQSISAEIVKANTEKVVLSAPSDIIDDVLVENKNGKLYIHFKPGLNISARNVAVKIFAKDFTRVEANSSASIAMKDHFIQDRTEVKAASSASISGNIEANQLSIDVSSSGTFTGKIWAVDLDAEVSSSGDIIISGETKNAKLHASSSGTLDARKATAANADIEASSSGSVSLAVKNQLSARSSSSGDITIRKAGNLNIISKTESSGGSVNIQ
ncbi:hypothetical protein OA84_01430 [Kaistella solincola]|uniref:Putative auto-transporter adhesin head GIN domain-containing protein n=1 Tax=Kaistella solincola TaxID=510955 RepID=A0ABR4ZSR6_9FLAO|nr:head GIN domain-containing protein [Kaistella solincola]KIA84234.1 hypothetical protein OA84_01430 [Kaistella solincola]